MPRKSLALILAAGEGTRMRSSLPKVMHEVAGRPMLHHVIEVSRNAGCTDVSVVAGNGFEKVTEFVKSVSPDIDVFEQRERLGTGHAVLAARAAIEQAPDDILVLFGDTPLLEVETLNRIRGHLADGASVVVLGFRTDHPDGYGRLLEDGGRLLAIREHKDANEKERKVNFCNGGIMGLAGEHALALLDAISNENANKEYYLTDVAEIANSKGLTVVAVEADETELLGVNTRSDLAHVESIWQSNAREKLLLSGVSMTSPETVFLNADTRVDADVVIEPNVVFGANVEVKSGARIRAFSHLEGAIVGAGAEVGPYARLRPGAVLGEKSKVGNFVELKKANLGEGAKVNHLTYVGDAEIGAFANIGAGTITCNYDGHNKHVTHIGANAFVGSNSSLVAPVTIGDGAYIASGSVITDNVPADGLGIARGKQVNKSGYGAEIRTRNAALKAERSKK